MNGEQWVDEASPNECFASVTSLFIDAPGATGDPRVTFTISIFSPNAETLKTIYNELSRLMGSPVQFTVTPSPSAPGQEGPGFADEQEDTDGDSP